MLGGCGLEFEQDIQIGCLIVQADLVKQVRFALLERGERWDGSSLRRLSGWILALKGTSKNSLLMPDEGIFCGSEERKPSHTLLYGTNVSWRSIGELAGRAQQRACFLSFVTKLLREKDRVWCEIGIFRGSLKSSSTKAWMSLHRIAGFENRYLYALSQLAIASI